jgi:hypothetical protein
MYIVSAFCGLKVVSLKLKEENSEVKEPEAFT